MVCTSCEHLLIICCGAYQAITKPLLRGRLLDNLKILNDIQEKQDADRHVESRLKGDGAATLERDVREGHRLMRFATAAYGVEVSAMRGCRGSMNDMFSRS